ncbi:MAG: hypothetical protein JO274_09395, partial [Gammaproteobacteria bacterium]|nr:hypothetical protein [Gammaproteobacteria bacterium]
INAALEMGQPGDLLLIFADALVRSWKQIIKFKPAGVPAPAAPPPLPLPPLLEPHAEGGGRAAESAALNFNLEGLIRDERGVRFAPEAED